MDALESALAAMGAAGADASADAAFHRALLAASGNEMPARLDHLLEPGLRARDHLVHTGHEARSPVPGHRSVLTAIRAGDADAAEAAMRTLLRQAVADPDEARAR